MNPAADIFKTSAPTNQRQRQRRHSGPHVASSDSPVSPVRLGVYRLRVHGPVLNAAAADPHHQSPAPAGSTDPLIGPRQTLHPLGANQNGSLLVERSLRVAADELPIGCCFPPFRAARQSADWLARGPPFSWPRHPSSGLAAHFRGVDRRRL